MTVDGVKTCGAARPATTRVVRWGKADVWKVGGKVFSICGWEEGAPAVTFKVTELGFEVLSDSAGLRPAPYLASRGFKWIQHYAAPGLSDDSLRDHLRASYDMIAAALPKRTRAELGL